jgi:F-type H+-transporting ATPase subunit delta
MNLSELARVKTVFDDQTRQAGRVYAEALYAAAERENKAAEVLEDLDGLVGGVFRQDPGLELFLASPSVSRERKDQALRHAFEGRVAGVFLHFLLVLNRHDRLGVLPAIAVEYRRLHERKSRRFRAQVRSAIPLTDQERGRLIEDLRAASQREPILEESVDPELLGGLVVRVGDWVYDTSVRTRLLSIRDELIERSSHDIERWRDRFRSH